MTAYPPPSPPKLLMIFILKVIMPKPYQQITKREGFFHLHLTKES